MESGKRKKRINYTVMVVSDSPDGNIRPFCLEQKLVTAAAALIVLLLAVSIGVAAHHSAALEKVRTSEEQQRAQIDTLTQENQELLAENEELAEKVSLLSATVAQNEETKEAQKKEEEEKKIPNGFPLAGPAVILESSETADAAEATEAEDIDTEDAQEKEPIVVFSAAAGIKVIATATGTVAAVEADEAYGYRVVIDHDNGYTSIYRIAAEPLVSAGDEILVGAVLYEIKSADERVGYQLTKDGTLIDPLDLLEVYG